MLQRSAKSFLNKNQSHGATSESGGLAFKFLRCKSVDELALLSESQFSRLSQGKNNIHHHVRLLEVIKLKEAC